MTTALKYFSVYLLSGLKFLFGPALGIIAYSLPLPIVILLTASGMMTTVYLFTFFGKEIRSFLLKWKKKKKRTFTKKNRRFVKIWRKFGLKGVCLLTPLVLTPPGGALLVNILGSNKSRIVKWMWISALFWSFTISLLAKYVEAVREIIQSVM